MKVLIACNRNSYKNPYVSTLADGLIEAGVDVTCSISAFWNNPNEYDIIHIMWPNLLVDKKDKECRKLQSIIGFIKKSRKVLMCTCHNIKPHYNEGEAINNAYRIIYESCDCIHHLGSASIKLLFASYTNVSAKNVVIPHHTYDKLYEFNISKCEARFKLNIPYDAKVIMSFGSFRSDEERELVINLADQLGDSYYYLMPGFYRDNIIRKDIRKVCKSLYNIVKYSIRAKKHNLHISHTYISDRMLPYYMAAADVMLIQRVKILNSGNISLSMLAGLPVVGPNVGNVGSLLRETGNYVFDTEMTDGIAGIIAEAIEDADLGMRNKIYARQYLATQKVSKSLYDVYTSLYTSSLLN